MSFRKLERRIHIKNSSSDVDNDDMYFFLCSSTNILFPFFHVFLEEQLHRRTHAWESRVYVIICIIFMWRRAYVYGVDIMRFSFFSNCDVLAFVLCLKTLLPFSKSHLQIRSPWMNENESPLAYRRHLYVTLHIIH